MVVFVCLHCVSLQVTEPVAGNYYPITAAAAITDGCLTLGLATDRCDPE